MAKAKLNGDQIAIVAGDVTVFNYDGETMEYLNSSVEVLPVGLGIPANSCIDAPGKEKEGFAICRTVDLRSWEYVADHRSETVYNTETGEPVTITDLGDYPKATTGLAPATPHDIWDGSEWVTDLKAQHVADVAEAEQQKTALIADASQKTQLWQTQLLLGMITDTNKAALVAWMGYVQKLQAIDTSTAPDIDWPEQP